LFDLCFAEQGPSDRTREVNRDRPSFVFHLIGCAPCATEPDVKRLAARRATHVWRLSNEAHSMPPGSPMTDITILRRALPGRGELLEFPTESGTVLIILIHRSGQRDFFVRLPGCDEPAASLSLTESEAAALVALLVGASIYVAHGAGSGELDLPTADTTREGRTP
jgi:hypothetical protein